jgi:mannose-1-phosphate guanylyltransferase/phosphomannomutase
MFSVAKILELIARSETSIDELDRQITKLNMKKENLECPKEMKGMIMRQFMEDNVKYKQELIDGVKIFINDNDTVLFTPDKHRGLVHLNVETNSEDRSDELIEEYKTKILSYIENYYN